MSSLIWLGRIGVVLTLMITSITTSFAQGLADFPDRLNRATNGDAHSSPEPFGDILCRGDKREELVRSAQADGIQSPDDFVAALHDMWCGMGEVAESKKLWARLDVPFAFTGPDQKRKVYRSTKALQKGFNDIQFFGRSPYYFAVTVGGNGAYVDLGTTGEGGGDEYEMVLRAGRWKIGKFLDGGAC